MSAGVYEHDCLRVLHSILTWQGAMASCAGPRKLARLPLRRVAREDREKEGRRAPS